MQKFRQTYNFIFTFRNDNNAVIRIININFVNNSTDSEEGREGRNDGGKGGRQEGWRNGRKEGWKAGRKNGRKGARKEGVTITSTLFFHNLKSTLEKWANSEVVLHTRPH